MASDARPDVFLSYAREDRSFADFIKGYFAARNREVWTDEAVSAGADWDEEVSRSLDASRVVILVLSPAFLRSKWNLYEAGMALAKQKEEGAKIIPIVVGDIDPAALPSSFRRVRLLDARGVDQRTVLSQVDAMLAA